MPIGVGGDDGDDCDDGGVVDNDDANDDNGNHCVCGPDHVDCCAEMS